MKRPPAEKKKTPKSKSSSSVSKENDVYQYENDKIRNEKNRAGDVSDDSDGEFKGDDESIDDDGSEVGWDSDDEMAYGSLLSKKSAKSSTSVQSDDSESDQEEPFEGEVLLSDMFASKPKSAPSDSKKTSSSKTTSEDNDDYDYDNDDNDSEEEEEEEEGEEEEGDEEEDESADNDSADESDDDNEAHNRLISAIDQFSKVADNQPEAKRKKISNQSAQESAFSSTADDGAVSMDALLGALGDSKGLSVVKKQLVDLEKGSVVPAYVEKVVAERIERTLAYEGTSLEMGKWQETVTSNRNIRTLDLAQDKRQLPNYKDLVKKFVPRTDMEREVQMILVKTGATDELAEKREEDELGSRNFSVEEMKERQAELAKVKALMFYEQMKRHRLNKIKSKAYRRIRKRQKGKLDAEQGDLADLDPELAREVEEKEALRQVKERMDMKHKNTGKWARMALQHGQHDESLRMAYHESVQLGHELSKRISEDPSSARRRGQDDEDDSSGDEGFLTETGEKQKASDRAAKEMLSVLEGAEEEPEVQGKYKKLFEMDFMKRASDQKKEKSREEAQNILREIQDMERDDESDDDDAAPNTLKVVKDIKEKDSQALIAARAEMKKQFDQSGGMSMALKAGSKRVTVSGPISVKGLSAAGKKGTAEGPRWVSEPEEAVIEIEVAAADEQNPWLAAPSSGKKRDSSGQQVAHVKSSQKGADKLYVTVAEMSAPAVSSIADVSDKKGSTKGQNSKQSKAAVVGQKRPLAAGAPDAREDNQKKNKSREVTGTPVGGSQSNPSSSAPGAVIVAAKGVTKKERMPLLMQKSQEDLVQMAFAGPDYEQDFNQMKDAAIDQELGIDEKRNKILVDVKAGWGDWAGPGATGVSTKILDIRNRLLKKVNEDSENKKRGRKDTRMPNVMISDRRIKTAAKYKISEIPHPFTTREEYERSIQMPLGAEWNASNVVKATSVPDILLRAGRIVQPIAMSKAQTNAAKKEKPPADDTDKKKMNRTIKANKKHKK